MQQKFSTILPHKNKTKIYKSSAAIHTDSTPVSRKMLLGSKKKKIEYFCATSETNTLKSKLVGNLKEI